MNKNFIERGDCCAPGSLSFTIAAKETKDLAGKMATPLLIIATNSTEVRCFSNTKASPFFELLSNY